MYAVVQTFAAVVSDPGAFIKRIGRNAIIYALAGLCVLSAYIAGLAALGLYLTPIYGGVAAALLIAAGMLTLALVLMATVLLLNRRDRRRRPSGRTLMATAAISAAPYLVRSRSPLMLAAVGGLGFLAAELLKDHQSTPPTE